MICDISLSCLVFWAEDERSPHELIVSHKSNTSVPLPNNGPNRRLQLGVVTGANPFAPVFAELGVKPDLDPTETHIGYIDDMGRVNVWADGLGIGGSCRWLRPDALDSLGKNSNTNQC